MEHRIDSNVGGPVGLPCAQFPLRAEPMATQRHSTPPVPNDAGAPGADAWIPTRPAEVVAPPIIDERAVRARLVALTRTHGPDPARDGLRMLESAVAASDELHRILAELDDLVGSGAGAASSEVHRLRIHAQQMLNSLRFQHSVSIDGSTLGDVLRGDIGSGDAQPDAAA